MKGRMTSQAMQIFESLKKNGVVPDVITFSSLISSHSNDTCMSGEEIQCQLKALVKEMEERGVTPNVATFNSCI